MNPPTSLCHSGAAQLPRQDANNGAAGAFINGDAVLWPYRGKDATGADTWMRTITRGTFLIHKHQTSGINLYRIEGGEKVHISTGFRSVKDAEDYMERMP